MAVSHATGAYQALPIVTQGGENHVFSPPEHFNGSGEQYVALMRQRYAPGAIGSRQQMHVAALELSRCPDPTQYVTGPYAKQAIVICKRLINPEYQKNLAQSA